MRKFCVAGLVLLVFASVGSADDEMWHKFSKLLLREGGNSIGKGEITNSTGTGVLEKGDQFTIVASAKRATTPTALTGTFVLTVADKPDVRLTATEVIGMDPAKKTINIVAYWSSKIVETITFDRCKDDTFFGKYNLMAPGSDVISADCAFVFHDDGTADFNFTSGPNKGNHRFQSCRPVVDSCSRRLCCFSDTLTA